MPIFFIHENIFYDYIPGFNEEKFLMVKEKYDNNAFWALFLAGFTPIPFKIFTVTAGVAKINLGTFLLAASIGRGMRFFLVATCVYFFGDKAKDIIEKHFDKLTILFSILLLGGFFLLKFLH